MIILIFCSTFLSRLHSECVCIDYVLQSHDMLNAQLCFDDDDVI